MGASSSPRLIVLLLGALESALATQGTGRFTRETRRAFTCASALDRGAAAIGFGCLAYSYLTLPDVRPLATTNPETTAFMELRDREARGRGKQPRRIHQWVSYNRISPHLKKAVLVAEDAAFWDHDGVDYVELQKSIELDWARGQLMRGASTITQQLAKNLYLVAVEEPAAQAARADHRAPSRSGAEEGAHPRAVSQSDRVGRRHLRRRGGGARVFRDVGRRRSVRAESALLAGAIINPRVLTPSRPTARLLRRQQIILSRMGRVVPPVETRDREPERVISRSREATRPRCGRRRADG